MMPVPAARPAVGAGNDQRPTDDAATTGLGKLVASLNSKNSMMGDYGAAGREAREKRRSADEAGRDAGLAAPPDRKNVSDRRRSRVWSGVPGVSPMPGPGLSDRTDEA